VHQERRSQSIFTLGQRDLGSAGLGETPGTPIELPATELAPAPFWVPLKCGASGLLPSRHGADARQKFPKAERLGDTVVGTQFQPDHAIDPVASIASGDDYRDIGARFDLAQQVGSIFLAKLQSKMTRSGSLAAKCWTISCRPDAAATRILYCSRSSPTMRLMIGLSSTMKMRAA
jgi:hypothetical protein